MAEVAMLDSRMQHAGGLNSMDLHGGPTYEMVPNPAFSFPSLPRLQQPRPATDIDRRPASVQASLSFPPPSTIAHRRAASTLPSFTFNAGDSSGLNETKTPPRTPEDENPSFTPSKRGHRRGGSEFVGGDSRLGVDSAVSSSPTKTAPPPFSAPVGPPAGRRGHAHRRSAAISSGDIKSLMQPSTEVPPRVSSSLPNTPLDHPAESANPESPPMATPESRGSTDPFGPSLECDTIRPPSRPRVGFSDNIEFIPRPLSTISSETESSISTVRGHSVNNSISSVMNLSTPSPPASRTLRYAISPSLENESPPRAKFATSTSRRLEKEGDWLKNRTSGGLPRPLSESAMSSPKTTFVLPNLEERSQAPHKKSRSSGHGFGFDRRRSEPSIGLSLAEPCRLSALSLQEPSSFVEGSADVHEAHAFQRRSSTRRIKDWAASVLARRSREGHKAPAVSSVESSIRPESAESACVPGKVSIPAAPVAETDLDAVFNNQDTVKESQMSTVSARPRLEVAVPAPGQRASTSSLDFEPMSPMLDLDAALGPFKTPPIGPQRHRKELHSDRLIRDFAGPGGHYHRRAESAPALPPFEGARVGTPSQSSITDVFEEDEEDDMVTAPPANASRARRSEPSNSSSSLQVLDRDISQSRSKSDSGLGIRGDWEPERSHTAHGVFGSYFTGHSVEGRASSIVEETIEEETSPSETVEIVEAHEEPRASSLTKSSHSSDTPTVLAPPLSAGYDGHQSFTTPNTGPSSTFSSPHLSGQKSSFDSHSRVETSASSVADTRTLSSYTTGDQGGLRGSVDDVPSLISGRSSTTQANSLRRDMSGVERTITPIQRPIDPKLAAERQHKRGSIQSLSQLMGGTFSRSKGAEESRPHTASMTAKPDTPKKKENRLKKLMFWRSKQHRKQ